ncbi:hypothetical protein CR513_31927, partial [Mucuna pruriens]
MEDHSEAKGKDHNEGKKENRFFGIKYQRQRETHSSLSVKVVEDDDDSKEVIDNMPIALRKGKRSCAKNPMYPISQLVYIDHLL